MLLQAVRTVFLSWKLSEFSSIKLLLKTAFLKSFIPMAEPLKNMYSSAFAKKLAGAIKKEYRPFPSAEFERHFSTKECKEAELKQRVKLIASWLNKYIHPE